MKRMIFLWATGLLLFFAFLPFALMKWIGTGAIAAFDELNLKRWQTARDLEKRP